MNKLHAYPNNNLSKYEWKELSSGDDLNEILGHYRTANNDIVKSLLNLPSAVTIGEITVDWYPVSYTSNFGTQMLRWTKNGESTIFSRAKYGSSTKWGAWVEYVTKDDLAPVKYTEFTAGTGKTITVNNSYCVGKLLIACLKVKIEGTGGQVVKIASNILNSGGTTIVGIGTEWSVTKSIYMYIGYDSLVVNEEDFALGQYLHICVPIVLK